MKVTKIPGLGRFGLYIDDLDFTTITHPEWMEVGQLALKHLVVIIRDTKLGPAEYEKRMLQFGAARYISPIALMKKYNSTDLEAIYTQEEVNGIKVDKEDKAFLHLTSYFSPYDNSRLMRVTGKRDDKGNKLGMFAEGELLWHSNESGQLDHTAGVSLLAQENVKGSATGFVTTTDWYEAQSESFRSELDEMIIIHSWTDQRIAPGLSDEQDTMLYKNMCPATREIPLVIQSPGGIKGLHFSLNTIESIKGMSKEESNKMFQRINKELEEYVYDHWYEHDTDLLLFDNSITQHRRLGGVTNRVCYRLQHDYRNLTAPINPYFQEPFISEYNKLYDEYEATVEAYFRNLQK